MTIKLKAPLKKVATVISAPGTEARKKTANADAPKTQRVTLCLRTDPGSKVFIAGSFNNWDPNAKKMVDKMGDGLYTATLNLPAGEHQYKFVIGGTWCADPACAETVQNAQGTINSLLRI